MAFRSLWEYYRNVVIDFANSLLRTQEEIDIEEADYLSDYATIVGSEEDVPETARLRPNSFLTVTDVAAWIDRAGIPKEYVTVLAEEDGLVDNYVYYVYVEDGAF